MVNADISKIPRSLDINKAHGDDSLLIRIIRLCSDSISRLFLKRYVSIFMEKVKYSSYSQEEQQEFCDKL